MEKINKNSPTPLYRQLEKLITRQIATGEYVKGDRIPSEYELEQIHEVSRVTVRKALKELETKGLIVRQAGKGTYVSRAKFQWPGPNLSSFTKIMSAQGLETTTKVLDFRIVPAPLRVAMELNLNEGSDLVYLRRLRSVNNFPSAITISYLSVLFYEPLSKSDLTKRLFNDLVADIEGRPLLRSHDSVEATIANEDEARHLGIKYGAPMLLIRGVVFTQDHDPIVSAKALFRGDMFQVVLASDEKPIQMIPNSTPVQTALT